MDLLIPACVMCGQEATWGWRDKWAPVGIAVVCAQHASEFIGQGYAMETLTGALADEWARLERGRRERAAAYAAAISDPVWLDARSELGRVAVRPLKTKKDVVNFILRRRSYYDDLAYDVDAIEVLDSIANDLDGYNEYEVWSDGSVRVR